MGILTAGTGIYTTWNGYMGCLLEATLSSSLDDSFSLLLIFELITMKKEQSVSSTHFLTSIFSE